MDENYINGKWEQKKKIGQILVSQNCHEWEIVSENMYKKNMGSDRFNAIGIVPSPNRDKLYFYVQNKFGQLGNYIECYSFPMNRIFFFCSFLRLLLTQNLLSTEKGMKTYLSLNSEKFFDALSFSAELRKTTKFSSFKIFLIK